jgi:AP-4 complex subunit epsilon-1
LRAQIKLLKTLALLGAGNKAASENMYAVVGDAMRRANTGHTIGNAIVYECVRTIAAIFPNPALLQSGAHPSPGTARRSCLSGQRSAGALHADSLEAGWRWPCGV